MVRSGITFLLLLYVTVVSAATSVEKRKCSRERDVCTVHTDCCEGLECQFTRRGKGMPEVRRCLKKEPSVGPQSGTCADYKQRCFDETVWRHVNHYKSPRCCPGYKCVASSEPGSCNTRYVWEWPYDTYCHYLDSESVCFDWYKSGSPTPDKDKCLGEGSYCGNQYHVNRHQYCCDPFFCRWTRQGDEEVKRCGIKN